VRFIAISSTVKESLNLVGIKNSQIIVIYNGLDINVFNPNVSPQSFEHEFPEYKERFKIGMLGRIEGWKRHIDVVEAIGLLAKQLDLHLFIVGEIWRENESDLWKFLQSRISKLRLTERVTFTGFRHDIPSFMAGLDVIIVPSIGEPFGRTTIEAMAMGKPVIGTLSGCTPEIIQHGTNGILVPVQSPESIAQAIETIATDRKYAQDLGFNARKRVVEVFSITNCIKRVQNVYLQRC
jgi:glycosyltransferase involved in cell wall biosynthesis